MCPKGMKHADHRWLQSASQYTNTPAVCDCLACKLLQLCSGMHNESCNALQLVLHCFWATTPAFFLVRSFLMLHSMRFEREPQKGTIQDGVDGWTAQMIMTGWQTQDLDA